MIISHSITSNVEREIETLHEGQAFVIKAEGESRVAYFKALSRLVKEGKLARIEKGKYYKPIKSRFGILRLSETELVKVLTQQGGKTVGYLTGNILYHQWGLTKQVPNTLTIARRNRLPEKELSGYKVKFVVRSFPFAASDILLLQLLDALTDIRRIPDAAPARVILLLAAKMKELLAGQMDHLIKLAMNYTPSTRALLGAVLETYFSDQDTAILLTSLNPSTKYRLKGVEDVLKDKAKWNFNDPPPLESMQIR
jgi:hypothetical protein